MDKDDIPFTQLVDSYRLFNKGEGKSQTTVVWYDARLEMFRRSWATAARSAISLRIGHAPTSCTSKSAVTAMPTTST